MIHLIHAEWPLSGKPKCFETESRIRSSDALDTDVRPCLHDRAGALLLQSRLLLRPQRQGAWARFLI